jgi:hypothetical protein
LPYPRTSNSPILAGDLLPEGEVHGFAYVGSKRPDRRCDRLILVGEEDLSAPPERPVPDTAASAVALAPAPPDRLLPERVHQGSEIHAGLPAAVDQLLHAPDAPWALAGPQLMASLRDAGHLCWIAGGFARDLVENGGGSHPNDLDFSGTAPPGRFTEIAEHVRKRTGLEYRTKVSDSLICYTVLPDDLPLYEYRTLNLPAYPFPASGSDLVEDASCRDFTVNSLLLDPQDHLVLDPTGTGMEHLRARPRELVTLNRTEDLADRTEIVLRAVKFHLRWHADPGVNCPRLPDLPAGWQASLSDQAWRSLEEAHASIARDYNSEQRHASAKALGAVAAELLDALEERTRA